MPRRRALRRALVVVAAAVVVLLVAVVVTGVVLVRRPLPQVSGQIDVPGLADTVTVTRDELGVPSITTGAGGTAEDLFMAQGYVNAQDRFFEMDYRRHVTAGRLSELVGEDADALDADKVIRTFGWRRVAEQEWGLLADSTRAYLQAYADGVNAYLDDHSTAEIAVEYTVLGLRVDVDKPEPWDPVDSLAWLKAMAWDLRGNYDDELERATTYASVQDVQRVDELFPAYPQDLNRPILDAAAVTLPASAVTTTALDLGDLGGAALQDTLASVEAALAAVPHLVGDGEGVGSNSWAVGGQYTASGKPLLANDPHLSLSAPGIWSQVSLRCQDVTAACPFDVSGFSFAGFPGVVIGHNGALAWGLTNLGADVTDFFLERVTGDETVVDDGRAPLTQRVETLHVNGGEDVELTVRSSVHGPIISDVLDLDGVADVPVPDGSPGGTYAVALAWTALTPGRTADAVFAFDTAQDAQDIAAAAALFEVPSQNIVFATADGHIGYQAPGRIPVRAVVDGAALPSDGTWPRPGWDSAYDWQGYVDPAQMPAELDPAEGFIVAANQAVSPAGTGPYLTADWDYGYRAQRIRSLISAQIAAGGAITGDMMSAWQLDDHSPYADVLVGPLLAVTLDSSFDDDGQALLRSWDRRTTTDSAAAAYFASVWGTLLDLTFADDLPDGYAPSGDSRWLEVVRTMLERPDDPWWDDRTTVGVVEGRDEILAQALASSRRALAVSLGKEPSDWQWGRLHTAAPQHPVLGGDSVPGLVRALVNPSAVAVGGGSSTVNATAWDAGSGSYAVTSAPSMRMVVDLADLDASTWVTLTGTSGHPGTAHYTDQLGPWARGETFPWAFTAGAVADAARDTLELVPADAD
ncbi:penicillin acylase family protein [Cellulomonas hominis]